jgi:hypothetical protein
VGATIGLGAGKARELPPEALGESGTRYHTVIEFRPQSVMIDRVPESRPEASTERTRSDEHVIHLATQLGQLAPLETVGTPMWLAVALREYSQQMVWYWDGAPMPSGVRGFVDRYVGV